MSVSPIWMVRAGKGAESVDDFIEGSFVAIDCCTSEIGPIDASTEKSDIQQRLAHLRPSDNQAKIGVWASQIKRFLGEVAIGDAVTTYDPNQRIYFLGQITSDASPRPNDGSSSRAVRWEAKIPRDRLSPSTRNTLGAISTLFLIQDDAAEDMRRNAIPIGDPSPAGPATDSGATSSSQADAEVEVLEDMATRSREFLEDRIAKLTWEQMQELAAEILRAMGYRARISPKGADRGVDIFASPDGLGLEEPRIFVEVKHRPGTSISADQVRSFVGGRQAGDRCLYVSTGGFTKDARYEAERSSIPLTLVALPELRELLTEHYHRFSPAGSALIPLHRLYWPAF
ncbi:Restriction endonuclease [Pirellulimonas nuda]|uniref:Restriction endonuclease n=1 Tax=Pirellulimonas nuda TaxID=2528009 RepID=A0A518DA79_9BACT|nr:restriction endonuclease [Pirellulimonas nuda]QDU88389.1 Restriction endonuclease [Pirellulimonas nuda]